MSIQPDFQTQHMTIRFVSVCFKSDTKVSYLFFTPYITLSQITALITYQEHKLYV